MGSRAVWGGTWGCGCCDGQGRRLRLDWEAAGGGHTSGLTRDRPEREPLQLPCEPLLLPRLSPLVRMEMPEKLLALVTGGRRVRLELSESVLLQGRGSRHFMSLSVLL